MLPDRADELAGGREADAVPPSDGDGLAGAAPPPPPFPPPVPQAAANASSTAASAANPPRPNRAIRFSTPRPSQFFIVLRFDRSSAVLSGIACFVKWK